MVFIMNTHLKFLDKQDIEQDKSKGALWLLSLLLLELAASTPSKKARYHEP